MNERCANCGDYLWIRKAGDIRVFHAYPKEDRKCKEPKLMEKDRKRIRG